MGRQQNKETKVLNIRFSPEIIRWLDSLVEKKIYSSRSEAIRDFLREFVLKAGGEEAEQ
ncbi:MAG: ribbon-helix-helix domain-containing protein [Candidatus Woesearchaeota archaeon]